MRSSRLLLRPVFTYGDISSLTLSLGFCSVATETYMCKPGPPYKSKLVPPTATELPLLFVEGLCGDPETWEPTATSIRTKLRLANPGKYSRSDIYYTHYDELTLRPWFELKRSRQPTDSVPPDARLFSVAFFGPEATACVPSGATCYEDYIPTNVAYTGIKRKADELAHIIWTVKSLTASPGVILVAHSMGGLVSRAYMESMASIAPPVQPDSYANDIRELVTIDTPHNGSDMAWLFDPFHREPACFLQRSNDKLDMIPNSDFIRMVNYSGDNG